MTELLDDLLGDLVRAEKKSDEGRALAGLLDQLAASTKSHRPRVVMEFVVKDGGKAGKVLKKLRTHGSEKVEKKASQIVKEWKKIVAQESVKKEKEKVEHVVKAETAADKVKCPIDGCTWRGFADKVVDHVEKSRANGCKKHGAIGLESAHLSGVEGEAGQNKGDE